MQFKFELKKTLLLLGVLISSLVGAADEQVVTVQNLTGVPASDLHVTFSGSGGNVTVDPFSVYTAICPTPVIPSNTQITNTVTIDWGVACVAPFETVTFTVRSINGPLTFVSGNWTVGGVPSGGITRIRIFPPPPPPPPPPTPFWKKMWQRKCVPAGPILRTAWAGLPGTPCWVRWVCIPQYTLYVRKVRCQYTSRNGRIIATGRCVAITNWVKSQVFPARYFRQRTTIRPPDLNDPGNVPIQGPFKKGVRWGREWGSNLPWSLYQVHSNDFGATSNVSTDMSQAFMGVYSALQVTSPTTFDVGSFAGEVQLMSPHFMNAAIEMQQLSLLATQVLSDEATASIGFLLPAINQIQQGLQAAASDFADGNPTNVLAMQRLRSGFTQLSVNLPLLGSDPRWAHAASLCAEIAEGLQVSEQQVANGLPDQTSQDFFLWGLQNRMIPNLMPLAIALGPHIEIPMDMGSHGWDASDLEGARVWVRNANNLETLDTWVIPMTSDGRLFVPTVGYGLLNNLEVRFKVDTFVSEQISVVLTNQSPSFPTILRNGDADGNDVVNNADVDFVVSTLGQGGFNAPEIPSSDLNNDGMVDPQDQLLAVGGLGQIGNGFFDVFFNVEFGHFAGDISNEVLDVDVTNMLNGDTWTTTAIVGEDGSASTPLPAFGSYRIGVKGRTWLRREVVQFFNPGSEPFIGWPTFINGDIDEDNEVGPGDFARLSAAFGAVTGDTTYDYYADLDGNEEIGPSDFSVLSSNFGMSGD